MSAGERRVGAIRVAAAQFRVCVLRALQYRMQFWTEGVLGVAWSLMGIAPLLVAMQYRSEVAGWGVGGLLVLTGVFTIMSGIYGAMVQPALAESMAHIRRGSLDYLLLRPVDAMVSCVTAMYSPWRLLEVVAGVGLVTVGIHREGVFAWEGLALGVALAFLGVVVLYAMGVLMLAASFRALRLENLTFMLEAMLDFGRWPIGVFRGLLKAFFTFVFPLAVLTTFPAEALLGQSRAGTLGVAVLITLSFMFAARIAWNRGIRHYTSASS